MSAIAKDTLPVPLPVVITREGVWFIATCPLVNLVAQGKTETEAKDNIKDLLEDFFSDPDTSKPSIETLMSIEMSNISGKNTKARNIQERNGRRAHTHNLGAIA